MKYSSILLNNIVPYIVGDIYGSKSEAARLYLEATEFGHAGAWHNLGECYWKQVLG